MRRLAHDPAPRIGARSRGVIGTVARVVIGASLVLASSCGRVGFEEASGDASVLDAARDAASIDGALDRPMDAGLDALAHDAGLDALAPDASSDAPSLRDLVCRAATTVSCLDFESEPPLPWATFNDGTSSVNLEPGSGFHGAGLRVQTTGLTDGLGAGYQRPIPAELATSGFYVTARVFVHRAATTGFLVLTEAGNGLGGAAQRKISIDFNGLRLTQLVIVGAGGISHEGGPEPLERWVCLQLAIQPSAAVATLDTDVIRGDVPFAIAELTALNVGAYAQHDAVDVRIDDVVVSSVPVDCLP